jgi:hypothetical protein
MPEIGLAIGRERGIYVSFGLSNSGDVQASRQRKTRSREQVTFLQLFYS